MAVTHLVPNPFDPRTSRSAQPVPLDKQNILGTIYPGDQIGWGQFVHGDRIFGDRLSMGTELVGDRLSRGTNQSGTNCGGSNVRGPCVIGTKCVTAGGGVGK